MERNILSNKAAATRRWIAILSVLSLSLIAQAQIESHLTYRRYTTQDGLPQMQTERV